MRRGSPGPGRRGGREPATPEPGSGAGPALQGVSFLRLNAGRERPRPQEAGARGPAAAAPPPLPPLSGSDAALDLGTRGLRGSSRLVASRPCTRGSRSPAPLQTPGKSRQVRTELRRGHSGGRPEGQGRVEGGRSTSGGGGCTSGWQPVLGASGGWGPGPLVEPVLSGAVDPCPS